MCGLSNMFLSTRNIAWERCGSVAGLCPGRDYFGNVWVTIVGRNLFQQHAQGTNLTKCTREATFF